MIVAVANNIISPLGRTTGLNVDACISADRTALRFAVEPFGVPATLPVGLLSGTRGAVRLAVESVTAAAKNTDIDLSSDRVIFIISTTKGGIPTDSSCEIAENETPGKIGEALTQRFGNPNAPIAVSNACVSGVSAQITAMQLLNRGIYDTAVIVGTDPLSRFIISGFMSFKALSSNICRPFETSRCGLNLGEAAATLILQRREQVSADDICLVAGSTHNDANHISGPSRTGEGAYRVLCDLLQHIDKKELSFISPHGTATIYNDEMEAIALHRAGLDDTPLCPLKARYGHTLGAAGVLETILSIEALKRGIIYGAMGYAESGVTYRQNIADSVRKSYGHSFIKLISGFGGVNAGVLYSKGVASKEPAHTECEHTGQLHSVKITPESVVLNGKTILRPDESQTEFITQIYKHIATNYPKFYKMDRMTRLGFVAAELLLQYLPDNRRDNCAIIFCNKLSSRAADLAYCGTIHDDDYYPAPALFVYTLPNIVTGEIAIRHRIMGETCFYVTSDYEWLDNYVGQTHNGPVLYGAVEYADDLHYLCNLKLYY